MLLRLFKNLFEPAPYSCHIYHPLIFKTDSVFFLGPEIIIPVLLCFPDFFAWRLVLFLYEIVSASYSATSIEKIQ